MAPPLSREVVTDSSDFSESDDSQAQLKKKESILKKKGKVEKSSKARAITQAPPSESSSDESSSEESSSEESSSEHSDDSSNQYEVPYGTIAINSRGDQIPMAKKPATTLKADKPANPPQSEKPGDKSSKDSDSTPKSSFVLPRGFKQIDPTRTSDVPNLFRNLGRKELWHISAPSDTTIDSIKQIPWNAVNTDRPVLTQNGVSYCFRSEPAPLITDEIMLLPAQNENVYYGYERLISRNFLLQEILDIPQRPSTIKQNGKRKAPKNLRMRYRPFPSEDGPPIDLGSISESDAEEDTFKFPPGSDVKKGNKKEAKVEGKTEGRKGSGKESKKESKKEDKKGSGKERQMKDRKEGREEGKKADKKESKTEVKEHKKGSKEEGKKRKHTEVNESLADREGASRGNGAELPRKKTKKQHTFHDDGKDVSPHNNRSSSKPVDEREHSRSKKSRKESERTSEETGRKARKEEKEQKKLEKLEKKGKLKA